MALGVACLVAEAGNQGREGMVAVAEVIRERTERKYNSNGTIPGTLFAPYQFSCFSDGTNWRARIFSLTWDDPQVIVAKQAWDIAFNEDDTGRRSRLVDGAVLYHTIQAPAGARSWPPRWATAPSVVEVARIRDHVFYRDNGR
jgi:spore germination cell wall hydrolase CwlJ-like protein